MPDEPTVGVVEPVVTPSPPPIPTHVPVGAQVEFLATTWEHAVSRRYLSGKPCGTFRRRGGVLGSDYFDLMADCVGAMLQHEVAPAAWLAFSFDVWDKNNKPKRGRRKKKPPPLKWAYDANRVEERRGWYRRELANMPLGGHVLFVETHRALMRRHARLRQELFKLDAPTDAQVHELVEHYFPGQLYNEMVRQAREESRVMRTQLKRRARRGEWLW